MNGSPMRSFERSDPFHFQAPHLEIDIELAARQTMPVLITARPAYAAKIVQAIAVRSHRNVIPVAPDAPPGTHDAITALADNRLTLWTARGAILWLKDVHGLTPGQQESVLHILRDAPAGYRIVGSTELDLYDLVTLQRFNATLFYRLNAIHIVVPESADCDAIGGAPA